MSPIGFRAGGIQRARNVINPLKVRHNAIANVAHFIRGKTVARLGQNPAQHVLKSKNTVVNEINIRDIGFDAC